MTELKLFKHPRFGNIRGLEINGQPWMVGKDIAAALGYSNTKDALSTHVDEEDKRVIQRSENTTFEIPNRGMTIINESGMYSLVLSSKLPGAREFRRWVTAEVLPSIRKTGGYVGDDELFLQTYLPNADEATRAMFLSTLATVRNLNARIEEAKPKVLFADAVSASHTSILVGDLAKLLRQNGVDIGQNRLFERLRREGYLMASGERKNMPTQKAMDMGLFTIKESTITQPDGSIRITRTVKVTGKGQQYFIGRYLPSA